MRKIFITLLIVYSLVYPSCAFADTIEIDNSSVLLITNNGSIINFTDNSNLNTYPFDKQVLGTSSGVTVTVSASAFLPTDTPVPLATLTPVPNAQNPINPGIPTDTTITRMTSTPFPAVNISPSMPEDNLIATVNSGTSTTTHSVNQVVQKNTNGQPIITITASAPGGAMVIEQAGARATTSLPVQLNTNTKTVSVITKNGVSPVISASDVINILKMHGSYIIPASIKINLIDEKGQPVYRIDGREHVQIVGLFFIDFPITIEISATNGKVIETSDSFFVHVLELLKIGKRVIQ